MDSLINNQELESAPSGVNRAPYIVTAALAIVLIGLAVFLKLYWDNKNNDQLVISEVNQIRSALEVYYAINTEYPQLQEPTSLNDRDRGTEKLCAEGFRTLTANCERELLNPVPNANREEGNQYTYQTSSGGLNYLLEFNLSTNQSRLGLSKGLSCATRDGLNPGACFNTSQ